MTILHAASMDTTCCDLLSVANQKTKSALSPKGTRTAQQESAKEGEKKNAQPVQNFVGYLCLHSFFQKVSGFQVEKMKAASLRFKQSKPIQMLS